VGPTTDDRLEGFHIIGGQGLFREYDDGSDGLAGGGIFIYGGSAPTITNNEIVGNVMDSTDSKNWYGAGIYVHSARPNAGSPGFPVAKPIITNNLIDGNIADPPPGINATKPSRAHGGGIYVGYHSAPTITGNTIQFNRTGNQDKDHQIATGGGIVFYSVYDIDQPVISRNRITDNNGTDVGGGISGGPIGGYSVHSLIESNLIEYNQAGEGGGISISTSLATIRNNTIVDNVAVYGGGVSVGATTIEGNEVTLLNNLLTFNFGDETVTAPGGGPYVYQAEPIVEYEDIFASTRISSVTFRTTSAGTRSTATTSVSTGTSPLIHCSSPECHP